MKKRMCLQVLCCMMFICAGLMFSLGNTKTADANTEGLIIESALVEGDDLVITVSDDIENNQYQYWLKKRVDIHSIEEQDIVTEDCWINVKAYSDSKIARISEHEDYDIDGYYYAIVRSKSGGETYKVIHVSETQSVITSVLVNGGNPAEVNYLRAGQNLSISTVVKAPQGQSTNFTVTDKGQLFTADSGETVNLSVRQGLYSIKIQTDSGSAQYLTIKGYREITDYIKITSVKINGSENFGERVRSDSATAQFDISTEVVGIPEQEADVRIKSDGQTVTNGGTITYSHPGVYEFYVSVLSGGMENDYYRGYYYYADSNISFESVDCPQTVAINEQFTITAEVKDYAESVTEDDSPLYQLIKWDYSGEYVVVDWTKKNSFDVTIYKEGQYIFEVRAKSFNAGKFETRRYLTVTAGSVSPKIDKEITVTDLSGIPISSIVAGYPYKVSVTESDDALLYKFIISSVGQWRVAEYFSPNNSFVWIPNKGGEFTIEARITASGRYSYADDTIRLQLKDMLVVLDEMDIIEGSIVDGLDVSAYEINGKTITGISLAGKSLSYSNGMVNFVFENDKELASADVQRLRIYYDDGTFVNASVILWTKFAKNEAELKSLRDYTYSVPGPATQGNLRGYFKLTADINITSQFTADNAITGDGVGFSGVLDGGNHMVSGINLTSGVTRGIIGLATKYTTVKNIKIDGTLGLRWGEERGFLADRNTGGTYENIQMYASITYDGYAKSDVNSGGSGALLGCYYGLTIYGSELGDGETYYYFKDIFLRAKDDATADKNYNSALLFARRMHGYQLANLLHMENVIFAGFKDLLITGEGTETGASLIRIQDAASLSAYCVSATNVESYASLEEYDTKDAVLLGSSEIDTLNDYDISSLIDGDISYASLNNLGTQLTISDGKVRFTKEQTSDKAQTLIIVDVDGKIYKQTLTIWNVIVRSEADWKLINSNLTIAGTTYSGYIKLAEDITITETIGVSNRELYSIASLSSVDSSRNTKSNIVLEGGGHTIYNWTAAAPYSGIICTSSANTIIRNLNVEGSVTASGQGAGLLVSRMEGGTFEDINITVNLPTDDTGKFVGVFGTAYRLYFANEAATFTDIVITADNETTAAALFYGHTDWNTNKSKIAMQNVDIVGFDNLMWLYDTMTTSTEITSVEGLIGELGSSNVNNVTMRDSD